VVIGMKPTLAYRLVMVWPEWESDRVLQIQGDDSSTMSTTRARAGLLVSLRHQWVTPVVSNAASPPSSTLREQCQV